MAPEEILAMIAQRHFEDSLAMIVKCEEYFARDSTFYNSIEIIDKVIYSEQNFVGISSDDHFTDQATETQSFECFVIGIIQLSES